MIKQHLITTLLALITLGGLQAQEKLQDIDHFSILSLKSLKGEKARFALNYPTLPLRSQQRGENDQNCFILSPSKRLKNSAGFVKLAHNLELREGPEILFDEPTHSATILRTTFAYLSGKLVAIKKLPKDINTFYVTGIEITLAGSSDIGQGIDAYLAGQKDVDVFVQFVRSCDQVTLASPINDPLRF